MRRRARTDANHAAIVAALRALGCTVQSLAEVGDGCPDLLVGCRGRTALVEVKDGAKPAHARRLTSDQRTWAQRWEGGPVVVVTSVEEATRLAMDLRKGVAA